MVLNLTNEEKPHYTELTLPQITTTYATVLACPAGLTDTLVVIIQVRTGGAVIRVTREGRAVVLCILTVGTFVVKVAAKNSDEPI